MLVLILPATNLFNTLNMKLKHNNFDFFALLL